VISSRETELSKETRVSFRYYLYISDSKVDMLLPQIDPTFPRKHTSELSLSFLKIFGARRSTESSAGTERIARLERVVRHLHDHGNLGSADEPGQFFWGLLPMQWGPFDSHPSLVYFGGRTEHTIVGLGGSCHHMLGSAVDPTPGHVSTTSLLPSLLDGLATHPEIKDVFGAMGDGPEEAERAALQVVHCANADLRGPAQNVEFVAKRLLHGPSPYPEGDPHGDISVLLGSPLYVASVD
jgi:hypothetical protein